MSFLELILPLYVLQAVIWWKVQHVIKVTANDENVLSDDDFFADTVDTRKESVEHHRKGECLKDVIDKETLLSGKNQKKRERVSNARKEFINKTYVNDKHRELNEEGDKMISTIGKHLISLYSTEMFQVVKISNLKKLQ